MQIKKFKAKTLREAIAEMKKEFGDEAIVLSTKVLDDFSNGIEQKIFEITASMDTEESFEVEEKRMEPTNKAKDFQTEIKKMTEKIYGVASESKKIKPNEKRNIPSQKMESSEISKIKLDLVDKDVDEKVVSMHNEGYSNDTIAKQLKVSIGEIEFMIKREKMLNALNIKES